MLYNLFEKNNRLQTAGKMTILTAVSGFLVFAFVFLFNAGKTELMKVEAQSATTTLTVLNIPPFWVNDAIEEVESSTDNPTNSGNQVSWVATADKSAGTPYFLLICSTATDPVPNPAPNLGSLGTVPPNCADGTQWGVSTGTTPNTEARVATTTQESWSESNAWFAWICDDDPINPRCNTNYKQGTNATNTSPFIVNHRPVFTALTNDSPKNPGEVLTFYSTSSDSDILAGQDNIRLVICSNNDFDASITDCTSGSLASTTGSINSDASASFTLPVPIMDDVYDAYAFIVDHHKHAAVGGKQGENIGFTVNNVAPTLSSGDITLNGGNPIILSVGKGETVGFDLDFTVNDANSCKNALGGNEIVGFVAALHRSGVSTTTCDGSSGVFDPNSCYPSGVSTTTWNLSCTPNNASCIDETDTSLEWNCSFPLWYLTDPTDVGSKFSAEGWVASIAGVDNNNATGTLTTSANVALNSFMAMEIATNEIPYGALEPGQNTGTLKATTTMLSVGNTGLNQKIQGDSMCAGYAPGTPCADLSSSTIPDYKQQFSTSVLAYGSGIALSSTTQKDLLLKVPKTTATSTPNSGNTFWGIEVPSTISVSGDYTGMNTFYAVISSSTDW